LGSDYFNGSQFYSDCISCGQLLSGAWTWRNSGVGNASFTSAQINGFSVSNSNMTSSVFPLTSTLFGITQPPKFGSGINDIIPWSSSISIFSQISWTNFIPNAIYSFTVRVNNIQQLQQQVSYGTPFVTLNLPVNVIQPNSSVEVIFSSVII
jgi:hypothetical protein